MFLGKQDLNNGGA